MADTSYTDEFYKVRFITTSSVNIPRLLRQTGGLIIMNNVDGEICTVNPDHGVHNPKSIWFRGSHIASGYGALCEDEREKLTYLAGNANSLFEGIDLRFDDVTYWMNSYYNEFKAAYSYTINTIDRVKAESYLYTDLQINHLIGCAPETLDTLGEIAHWLEHDKELGLDAVTHIHEIANSYVTHEPIDENEFVYLSNYGWRVVTTPLNDIHQDPSNPSRPDEDCSGGNRFSYESFSAEPYGTIAMRDHQVSTHYANAELDRVLDLMLHPYPYTEPTVECISYNITTADTRYSYSYAEIGEVISWNVDYQYYVNDSELLLSINIIKGKDVTKCIETQFVLNAPIATEGIHSINGQLKVSKKENELSNMYSYVFKASPQLFYPLLKELEIYDDKHLFEGAVRQVEFPILIRGRWRAYAKSGDINLTIPTNSTGLTNDCYYWLEDIQDEIIILDDISANENIIWFALPSFYNHTVFHVYLENIHSGIKQEIKPTNLNGLNDSAFLTYRLENTFPYKLTEQNYNVYVIENKKFNMANQYRLIIENLNH